MDYTDPQSQFDTGGETARPLDATKNPDPASIEAVITEETIADQIGQMRATGDAIDQQRDRVVGNE